MLNEKEINVSDDDDFDVGSAYIVRDKYEKKAVEIYKKMCKLKEEPNFLENPPIRFKSTKNVLVNKTIEKYYNINKSFPDYFEVYTLLKTLNEKKKLNWSEKELSSISQDAFLKLGKQLKVLRLNDYFSSLSDMITDKDPAEENEELKNKLEESNKKLNEDLNKAILIDQHRNLTT
ncbi:daxx-like protein isoform X2 [Daktulosphaira vitifoliae]|uniref:daxx-like protein isoform X2 n=1 Tax=Daktulosphaira vitifoliae TaxID=58002 RepID=UPI0021A9BDE7|nr:daxx-like protein isoform X2 [Daktulosphaira vitifoliae]